MTVTLAAGPPCAGKTTWVRGHAAPGDEVLDWDEVFAAVSGAPLYIQQDRWRAAADREFRRRLGQIGGGWIIRCAPKKQHRAVLARIHNARVVVLETPAAVCLERLAQSERPDAVKVAQRLAIARWWADYERSSRGHEIHIVAEDEPKRSSRSREW